jgi:hypothetical protein
LSSFQEQQTLVISNESGPYFGGDVTGSLLVDSSYREYQTATLYTFSNSTVQGRTPPEFYVKFWTSKDVIKSAIDVSSSALSTFQTSHWSGTVSPTVTDMITYLYNNINSVPNDLSNVFIFNALTTSSTTPIVHPGGVGTINNRFKEMKWNHNSVNTNVSLPDFFKNTAGLTLDATTDFERDQVKVTIDVSGITQYYTDSGSVKLPFNLKASPTTQTYGILSTTGQTNVINKTGTLLSITQQKLQETVNIPDYLNESGYLTCKSTLSSIDIPDRELNTILYDLMRKYRADNGLTNPITTITQVRNLIDSMSGIVSNVASVPLNFYVAVRLFNPDNTTNPEQIRAVGAATSYTTGFTTSNYSNTSPPTSVSGQTMPSAKTLSTNQNLETGQTQTDPNKNFPQSITATTQNPASQERTPGVLAARNLYIWIVFKDSANVTDPSYPVNPNVAVTPSTLISLNN